MVEYAKTILRNPKTHKEVLYMLRLEDFIRSTNFIHVILLDGKYPKINHTLYSLETPSFLMCNESNY